MILKRQPRISSRGAAAYLGVSPSTLYRLVRSRKIHNANAWSDGAKFFLFDTVDLDWFLHEKRRVFAAKHYTEAQKRRALQFDEGLKLFQNTGDDSTLIRCTHHSDRIANRSGFVMHCKYQCGSCKTNRRRDGIGRPAHVRNFQRRNYKQSMHARMYGRGRMDAVAALEHITGRTLADFGYRRIS
jgi:hypothetical protein